MLNEFLDALGSLFTRPHFQEYKFDPTLQAMGKIVDDFSRCRYTCLVLSILMSESMLRSDGPCCLVKHPFPHYRRPVEMNFVCEHN